MGMMNPEESAPGGGKASTQLTSSVQKAPGTVLERICDVVEDAVLIFDVDRSESELQFCSVWQNEKASELFDHSHIERDLSTAPDVFGKEGWNAYQSHFRKSVNEEMVVEFIDAERAGKRRYHLTITPISENGSVTQVVAIARDISGVDRRDAQYRDLFESSRDAIMVLDEHGYRDCNKSTIDLFGVSSRGEFLKTAPWELSPPTQPDGRDSTTAAQAYIDEAFESGSVSFEWVHERRDGSTFPAEVTLSRFTTADGPALHAIVRDITERKSFESDLSALHTATRSFIRADSRQAIAEAAVATAEELLGFTLPSIWFPNEDETALELVANSTEHQAMLEAAGSPNPTQSRESLAWNIFEGEQAVVRSPIPPDELAADVPLHSAILCPLGNHGLLACATKGAVDFSERETRLVELLAGNVAVALDDIRTTRELERQQRFTTDLIDAIEDVVYVLDRRGSMVMWNDAFETVTGYSQEGIESMNAADFFAAENAQVVRSAIDEAFATGRIRLELGLKTAGGETIPYEFIAQTFEAPDGEQVLAGIGRDRTVHLAYEARLEEQRDNLELLNQVVRHDIRNDLMLIDGYARVLEDDLGGEEREHLQTIQENVSSAISLTNTARELSEVILSTGFDAQPIALVETLEREVEELRSAHPQAVLTLVGDLEETTVRADEMLGAVFRNILQNAIHHNDKAVPRVEITVECGQDVLTVRVADNGPGIPDARKNTIFEKGKKCLDSSGTGLGLYLVQTLIDRYDGDVSVHDNDPEGTVFTVTLNRA